MSHDVEDHQIGRLILYATLLVLGYLAYRVVQPFLVEIGWAVVLAICLAPAHDRLRPRLGPARASAVLVLLTLVLLVTPAISAGLALLDQGPDAVAEVNRILQDRSGPATERLHAGWAWARDRVPRLPSEEDAIQILSDQTGSVARFAAERAGGVARDAASVMLSLIITLLLLFFLLRDSEVFASKLIRVLPFGRQRNQRLLSLTGTLVTASVTASLAVALVQGLLGGLTLAMLGIRGAMLGGLMMMIASLIPVVGCALVWVPVAMWQLLSGHFVRGVVLVAVGLLVNGNMDHLIRPLFLSGAARMSTLVVLVSMMGGVSAFGFIGVVLGPVVLAVLAALVESESEEEAPVPSPPTAPAAPPVQQ